MPTHPASPDVDTIVAISTPPGRGGIGIVRLAGPQSLPIAAQLLQLTQPLEHARARFARVLDSADPNAKTLDDAIVTAFLAPHSYTGDDLIEIAAHGSPVVLEAIVRAALSHGARLATPGEFTQRAFLSGRLDLTQAEAVHDLIAAQTLDQARVAAQQMGGAMSRRVAPAKESLLHLIALLEAGMDFASGELDDVDVVPPSQIEAAILSVQTPLEALAASFRHGQMLRSGASLALVGRPNAGKSSLFNRLLERDRAIVTPLPGTTRDTVEESLALGGIPLRLIDTAGLRLQGDRPADEAEALGIARSHEALADADLVLLIHDATQTMTEEERTLAASLEGRPHLLVLNKIDLQGSDFSLKSTAFMSKGTNFSSQDTSSSLKGTGFSPYIPTRQSKGALAPEGTPAPILTSALTGEGLEELRTAILRALQAEGALADSGALNNLRQQEAVATTLQALATAQAANINGLPHELMLLDLHAALRALDSLTGATTTDDILGRIFSTFCIGK
ncbi:tRNA modification GTPase TrmE [Granulicella mallensis MP5ACTX8]|uniref:tRNA modification GTPase MnmE n=2 Tax=Granulicella mallensis TaxID=940614 RepID=G8NZN7_GRAMM|nr:tRNA modification GTPase TrmE [Granulicella mallensis MP5ACTX8]